MKIMFLIRVTANFEQKKKEIEGYLKKYIRPDTNIVFRQISKGFPSIESDLQGMFNGCQVVEEVLQAGESFDGIYVNCFDDPGVYACRELGRLPVIGPYQSALSTASVIAERIGIITTDKAGILSEERKARLGGTANIVSIRPVNLGVSDIRMEQESVTERLLQLCREMADADRVTAICLGCTAMFYIVDALRERLRQEKICVSIIEPMANAVSFLERMIQQKLVNYVPLDTVITRHISQ